MEKWFFLKSADEREKERERENGKIYRVIICLVFASSQFMERKDDHYYHALVKMLEYSE